MDLLWYEPPYCRFYAWFASLVRHIFRNVLVPLAGQREALLLKDAKTLAKNMVKQLPASRHGEAGEAIAEAFLVEAKMQK